MLQPAPTSADVRASTAPQRADRERPDVLAEGQRLGTSVEHDTPEEPVAGGLTKTPVREAISRTRVVLPV